MMKNYTFLQTVVQVLTTKLLLFLFIITFINAQVLSINNLNQK